MRFRLAPLVLVAGLVVAGCSDSADGGTDAQTQETPDPNDVDNPAEFDFTSTITITESGYVPRQAVAVLGETLTFVNNTSKVQTIRFTNGAPNITGDTTIGPIEPGQSVSFPEPLSATISLQFESSGLPGQVGRLQVDPGIDSI